MMRGVALDSDIPCMICGYNLRGLTVEARCPECGEEIDESVRREVEARKKRGVPIEVSDPRWLRRLSSGGALILVAAGMLMIYSVLRDVASLPSFGRTIILFVLVIATGTLAIGAWRVGTPEGLATDLRGSAALCATFRTASLYPFLALLLLHAPPIVGQFRMALISAFSPFTMIATWAGYLWIARVLVRTDQPRWATWARRIAWALPVMILVIEPAKYWDGFPFRRPFVLGSPFPITGYAPSSPGIFVHMLYRSHPIRDAIPWAVVNATSFGGLWIVLVFTRRLAQAMAASAAREKGK
jgi:hypothetical protein